MAKKFAAILLTAMLSLLFTSSCLAEGDHVLCLPPNMKRIEAYAFENCTDIVDIAFPDQIESIGSCAFSGCSGLQIVTLPSSLEYIADDAFPQGVYFECEPGSYAAQWVEDNGYPTYESMVRYYALIIGQSYENNLNYETLYGPAHDASAMDAMLGSMDATPYSVTRCTDLTRDGILSALKTAYAGADPNDVCLFYYSGHGRTSGALVGSDGGSVTISSLRNALDKLPCDRIVILDSCYSGKVLPEEDTTLRMKSASSSSDALPDLDAINDSIISVFARRTKSSNSSGNYYIMTSAAYDEKAAELPYPSRGTYYGVFTCGLLAGSGYDEKKDKLLETLDADMNADNAISLDEAYTYAYTEALRANPNQHAQVYPVGSAFTLWGR